MFVCVCVHVCVCACMRACLLYVCIHVHVFLQLTCIEWESWPISHRVRQSCVDILSCHYLCSLRRVAEIKYYLIWIAKIFVPAFCSVNVGLQNGAGNLTCIYLQKAYIMHVLFDWLELVENHVSVWSLLVSSADWPFVAKSLMLEFSVPLSKHLSNLCIMITSIELYIPIQFHTSSGDLGLFSMSQHSQKDQKQKLCILIQLSWNFVW